MLICVCHLESYLLTHLPTYLITLSLSLDNIRVMVIVWRLKGNIIRTALCWIVQSAAYLREQLLQVQQIGFVTFGPLRHA